MKGRKWRLSEDNVAKYDDSHAEKEAGRLVRDAYHGLELRVALHYPDKHLPGRGRALGRSGSA